MSTTEEHRDEEQGDVAQGDVPQGDTAQGVEVTSGDPSTPSAPTRTPRRRPARRARRARRGSTGIGLSLRTPEGEVVHVATAPVTEGLRYMVGRLRSELPHRLGIISAIPGEGVTSTCRSLAVLLAHDTGKRICIVDLNWGTPSSWPGDDEKGGVAGVLRGEVALDAALRPTVTGHLFVLPAGVADPGERPILASSPELEPLLAALERTFDHVIVDLPAIHATSEALVLAERAGALAVVVRQGVTSEAQVKAAVEELHGLPVIGVILNRATSKVPRPLRRLVGV